MIGDCELHAHPLVDGVVCPCGQRSHPTRTEVACPSPYPNPATVMTMHLLAVERPWMRRA